MSDSMNFAYGLDVNRLTGPAGSATEAIARLNRTLAASQKLMEKLEATLPKVGAAVQHFSQQANTGFLRAELAATRFSATTSKIEGVLARIKDAAGGTGGALAQMTARAERAARASSPDSRRRHEVTYQAWWEQQTARMEKAELQKTKALEREAMKRARLAEQEQKAQETAAARAQKAAEKAAQKAYEQTGRGAFLGGHHSFGGLLHERALAKVSGMGSGLAASILGMPGSLAGGALILAGRAVSAAAEAAWDLARAGAEGAFSFAKMAISAQALREQSVEGFKSIYGSESVAERLFTQAVRIAKTTKFDTPEVVEVFNTLAAGGFKEGDLEGRFGGYSDVASARGTGYARRYLTAIQKLNAQPNAMFATFQQAAMAGPGLKLAEEILGKQLGLSGEKNLDAKLREMFRDKKISGDTALKAIEGAVSSRYDQGGALGTYARNVGMGTWEGLISNIRNGLGDVLTMKLPADHPMNKLKDVLKVVNTLFDDQNPRAQRFNEIVGKYLGDIFSLFDISGSTAESAVDRVLKMLEQAEPKFNAFMSYLKTEVLDPVLKWFEKDGEFGSKISNLVMTIGVVAGKALFTGMKQGVVEVFTSNDEEKNNRKAFADWFKAFADWFLGRNEVTAAVNGQVTQAAALPEASFSSRYGSIRYITVNQTLPPNAKPADFKQEMIRGLEEELRQYQRGG